ncbi:MAG: putative dehydrogenase [Verrucomicrobiales bacterium]|jgi:predicted dehydrogenase
MKNPSLSSRRQFLKRSAMMAAAPTILPSRVLAAPSEKLNLAGVGIGGMGAGYLMAVSSENIVALCDVDHSFAAKTFAQYPAARRYTDYRELLEKEKHIDGVVIGTPDHWHAPVALAALELKKAVYCAKPLTHTVWEARKLTEAAKAAGVATQMSVQANANEEHRLIAEWIGAGLIGKVTEVHTWSNRPVWPQGITRPIETPAVPQNLDWNLWLGPAPQRPYNPAYHPFKWRGFWDFGCGALGDMGCHHFDPIFRALKLDAPVSVEAEGEGINDETAPNKATIIYEFPARGELPAVKVVWYDGGNKPPRPEELEPGRRMDSQYGGTLYIGDKGKILTGGLGESPRIIPESKMKEATLPEKTLARSPGHYKEWILAAKGGAPAGAEFSYGGPITETVLLGNVALRAGEKLAWDSAKLEVTNSTKANAFLTKEYRKGFAVT